MIPAEDPWVGSVERLDAAWNDAMAKAWDEGRKHGATYPCGQRGLGTDDNPYRSAK